MGELDPIAKQAFIQIDFVKRYEELSLSSRELSPFSDRLERQDKEKVLDILSRLGYPSKYDRRESFYQTKKIAMGVFTYYVNISLRYGLVELIWVIRKNGECIIGAPLGAYSRDYLCDTEYIIRRPAFSTYEQLKDILKISFEMFEDYKKCFIELQNANGVE